MKITTSNYTKTVNKIGLKNLPAELQEAHHFLKEATKDFKNWNAAGAEFHTVKKLAFEKLEEVAVSLSGLAGKNEPLYIKQAKEDAKNYQWLDTEQLKRIYRLELDAELEGDATPEESKIRKTAIEKELKNRDKKWLEQYKPISGTRKNNYDPKNEIEFINRFLEFRNKLLKKRDIKPFIDDLQEAIESKKIRKHSPYAKQILKIQKDAVYFYNQTTNISRMIIGEEWLKELYGVIVDYENRENEKLSDNKIEPKDLSGLSPKNTDVRNGEIVPSLELAKKEFTCIGFTGKWLELIGDPCAGFTAMIFGKPKMGKSYLSVDFAGYLAKNFGKVLYVAKEEKFGATFAKKLEDKNAIHENLIISDSIPEDLSPYEFIFLDSTNSLNLSPEDLRKLKEQNPGKSFVFVFQTTKTGNFRGENTFQHDVDIVIEIPERGKAVQFGRFNQGGEILIFEDAVTEPAEDLNGISKSEDYPKWVTPKILDKEDHEELKKFYKLYKHKKFKSAMKLTDDWDTFLRDQIPPMIWKEIGGELTPSGEARLKRQLKKQEAPKPKALKTTAPFDPSKYSNRSDAENPQYIFNSTSTNVLVEALKGDFDVVYMVRRELANRGLDENGLWIGFDRAKQIHRIS